jgi:peptidyl-prolyl cis-trans isomerase C
MVLWNCRARRPSVAVALVGAAALWLGACNEQALEGHAPDAGARVGGLSPEQASAVVAKVGDRVITLGEFAAALERMNQYDRLRYQTKEQRRKLLEDMIDSELLAQEARRRGLDKQEGVQQQIDLVLRDAMLAKARESVPALEAIPADEVSDYYAKHRDRFEEPERRRVSAIVMSDRADAENVLGDAKRMKSDAEWGELFFKHSLTAPKQRDALAPNELAGDLGIVGPVGDGRGDSGKVPEPVQRALFTIADVGQVHGELVEADGKLYVVRRVGRTAGRSRSLVEAERSIRMLIYQERVRAREAEVVAELRRKLGVQTDEKALAEVKLPAALERVSPHWAERRDGGVGGGLGSPPRKDDARP